MTIKLPKYVCPRNNKHRSTRFYFKVPVDLRPNGWPPCIPLSNDIGEMFKQADILYERLKSERTGAPITANTKGSIPWLLELYHQSKQYKDLAPSTKELYGYCAKNVLVWSKKSGHPHVRLIMRSNIIKFLEQFDKTPTKKKKIYVFLRLLLVFAYDHDEIENNPAMKIIVGEDETKVRIWKDEEIEAMIKVADSMGYKSVGTAILLGSETGQRQGDILDFQYDKDYQKDRFVFWQNKTDEFMSIRATQPVKDRLKGYSSGYIVPTKEGKRYIRLNFLREFTKVAKSAGLKDCKFKGLRNTAILRLARSGCTHSEIASISGHTESSIASILKVYLGRDTQVADNAIDKVEKKRAKAERQRAKAEKKRATDLLSA